MACQWLAIVVYYNRAKAQGENKMKFYNQLMLDGKPLFDVVWGSTMEDDETLALVKSSEDKWIIIDIATGVQITNGFKSKKATLNFYNENKGSIQYSLPKAREKEFNKLRRQRMSEHKILHSGDRCTYIDVKDSVILTLIEYDPRIDKWVVEDEWNQFCISPDRLIKVSEVN